MLLRLCTLVFFCFFCVRACVRVVGVGGALVNTPITVSATSSIVT